MKLMTSQKDSIFDAIEDYELSPSQFELKEIQSKFVPGQIATYLTFKNSDFFFLFETSQLSNASHYALFSPGTEAFHETENTRVWKSQFVCFLRWLSNLVREIAAPNKWDRFQKEIESLDIAFKNDEDKFSASEYNDLQQKITLLKSRIITIGLSTEQSDAINSKLDHLTDLAINMNKFDWKGLFIGTIISIIIQLSVTPDNAKSLWEMIKQIFSSYLLP